MHKAQEKTLPEIRREKQLEAAVIVNFLTIWISNFTLLQKKKKTTISVKKWNIYVSQSNTTEGHFFAGTTFWIDGDWFSLMAIM